MTAMLPSGKPQLKKEEADVLLSTFDVAEYPVKLLGIRGYFKKSMGNPETNDISIYDDAIFVHAPNSLFIPYNANTDPSRKFKGVAILKPGMYLYKIGMHGISGSNPHRALRQHGRVTVLRDGVEHTDSADAPFWINIHKGGYGTTSSLGCQTIYPDQFAHFIQKVEILMLKNRQKIIPYCLVEY